MEGPSRTAATFQFKNIIEDGYYSLKVRSNTRKYGKQKSVPLHDRGQKQSLQEEVITANNKDARKRFWKA